MVRWEANHKDGLIVKSGPKAYKKINRNKVTSIDFYDDDNLIVRIPVKKKFLMRRHVLANTLTGEQIGAIWVVGYENKGLIRNRDLPPTVTYLIEEGFIIESFDRWIFPKPIPIKGER